jgi:hypothetical protein
MLVLVAVLQWVADATPPESLHVPGVHDGGDYDSLVQPRLLTLTGLPDALGPRLAPLGKGPGRIEPLALASPFEPVPSSVQTRAPPAR